MCVVMVQRDRKVDEWEQIFRNNNVKVVKVGVGRLDVCSWSKFAGCPLWLTRGHQEAPFRVEPWCCVGGK